MREMDGTSGGVLIVERRLDALNFWERPHPARRAAVTERAAQGARKALGEKSTLGGRRRAEGRPTPLPVSPVVPDAFAEAPSNWKEIVRLTCQKHSVSVDDLINKKAKWRKRRTVACFQEIAYRLLRFGRFGNRAMKLAEAARVLKRAHSTVRRAARQFERRRGWAFK